MPASVLLGVVWVAVVALVGAAAIVRTRGTAVAGASADRGPTWRRFDRFSAVAIRELGRPIAAGVVVAAGVAITIAVCWMLGRLAGWSESAIDHPLFRWFEHRQVGGVWNHANNALTKMGNGPQTQLLSALGAVVFAVVWAARGRRWWAPLVTLPIAYLCERFGAEVLRLVVHRGHPPTTLGTWPSGGCARLILIYGLIIFMIVRWTRPNPQVRAALWSVLAVLAAIEAYTRVYLLKHWFTDVIGGLIYGMLLLATMTAGFSILDRDTNRGGHPLPAGIGAPEDMREPDVAPVIR